MIFIWILLQINIIISVIFVSRKIFWSNFWPVGRAGWHRFIIGTIARSGSVVCFIQRIIVWFFYFSIGQMLVESCSFSTTRINWLSRIPSWRWYRWSLLHIIIVASSVFLGIIFFFACRSRHVKMLFIFLKSITEKASLIATWVAVGLGSIISKIIAGWLVLVFNRFLMILTILYVFLCVLRRILIRIVWSKL